MPGHLNTRMLSLVRKRRQASTAGPGATAAVSGENLMMPLVSALAILMLHFYFWQVMMVCLMWWAFAT